MIFMVRIGAAFQWQPRETSTRWKSTGEFVPRQSLNCTRFPGGGKIWARDLGDLTLGAHEGFTENYEVCGMKFEKFAVFRIFLGKWKSGGEFEVSRRERLSEIGLWAACPP
jgi:hypothetical protein